MDEKNVIHDWNGEGKTTPQLGLDVALHDETLRDGIQCPSIKDPDIEDKYDIVRLLSEVGVDSTNVGLPGAGKRAVEDSERLVTLIRDEKLNIRPTCAARTHPNDIQPIIDISQRTGMPIEVMTFLGSSPIRMYAETWDENRLEALTRTAIKMSVQAGLPTAYVTEDTIRSHPETLRRLFTAAIEEGATSLILCDTVGHATPDGVKSLVNWTQDLLDELEVREKVGIEWHGHNDRGLGLVNALYAMEAGVQRIHGTILGIGERVGNTALDLFMVNIRIDGSTSRNLNKLSALVELVSKACGRSIPTEYPVFGRDAFRTGTGVHAAAVIKAEQRGDAWLADRIYSGVPASWVGKRQEIEIGHQSGESNIRYWLEREGIDPTKERVQIIFDYAKSQNRMLESQEILALIQGSL